MNTTAQEFLRGLFSSYPLAQIFIRQLPSGHYQYVNAGNPVISGDVQTENWFFGVCPRDQNGNILGISQIWADIDNTSTVPDVALIAPPSVSVNSGHGVHLYHLINRILDIPSGIRLTQLSSIAFDSDPSVCEQARIMRLPGSINNKYPGQPIYCVSEAQPSWNLYTPEDLEERLVAASIVPHWVAGQRHQLTLSLAGLLFRANWQESRALNVLDHLCAYTGDYEVDDRKTAARSTFSRGGTGNLISSSMVRDLLQDKYQRLIVALGITARDGDLIYNDEVFGKTLTLERSLYDLANKEMGHWSYAEGVLTKWIDNHWHHYDDKVLRKELFDLFSNVRTVTNGIEIEFNAQVKTTSAIMQVFIGQCMLNELPPPNPNLVPVKNCVIEMPTLKVIEHDKSHYNRFVFPVEYDPSAECPTWKQFLWEATGDEECYWFLQEWFGYTLRLTNPKEWMVWLQGPSGTGKSTCIEMNYNLFGAGAIPISPNDLDENVIAMLANAYVGVCAEISRRKLQTRRLNELVSGDVVKGRFLYGRQFDVKYTGKIMWSSNTFPPVDEGEGLWRRIITIPFANVPKKRDDYLKVKLRGEMPGVLNWALQGLERVIRYEAEGHWPVPKVALELLEAYRESAEVITQFRDEYLEMDPNECIPLDELYLRYKTWSEAFGHKPLPCDSTFLNEMKRIGLKRLPHRVRFGNVEKRALQGAKFKEIVIQGLTGR